MKYFVRFLALCFFITLFQPVSAQIDFQSGSSFKYLKGNAANGTPAELMATSYNDASWISGAAPFRYADGSGGTVLSDMRNLYSTFFLRTNFTAQKAENIKTITFSINYDDAFVIVINGVTALSVNAPTSLSTTALALSNHESGTNTCLLYTSPSPRDGLLYRMPS